MDLRKYIKVILEESFLDEEYPSIFNLDEFKALRTFKDRVSYCEARLKRIGAGSSRIVYQIDNEKVLKLAKNKKGIAQNETEIDRGSDSYFSNILAQVFESDDNGLWVEMELASKINAGEFRVMTTFDVADIGKYLINFQDMNNGKKEKYFLQKPLEDRLDNDDFVQSLREFVAGTDALAGDLAQISSYGLVKRDGADEIVLVDFGITENIYKTHYARMQEGVNADISGYKKWKRKNVTLRGMSKIGQENGAGAMLGDGLYTAALGNKALAKQYGTVNFVLNGRPKKPIVFNDLNKFEIWLQILMYNSLGYKDKREFSANTNIKDEVKKLGYDGIEIKGREMVNYSPDNVMYFQNENQLIDYYEMNFGNKIESINEVDIRVFIRSVLKENLESKFSDDFDFLKHNFNLGDCDIYATSLHRLYGYPLYIVRGWFLEPEWGGKREWDYEDSHVVVKLPNGHYMDSHGETTEDELRQNCAYANDIAKITFEPISEEDALSTFSCQNQEADIKKIMNYIKDKNINEDLEKGEQKLNKYVYHKASINNRDRIEKDGIQPFRGSQWLSDTRIKGNAVFATNSEDESDWFDSSWDDDVWRIDTTKLSNVKWFMDPNFSWNGKYEHIYTQSSIPRNAIELIKQGTGEDLLESKKTLEEDNNIWLQGGILLIKGQNLEDRTQKLFATHIESLDQRDRIKIDATPGQAAKMATLTGELYRLVIEDGKLKTYRVDWSNEKSLIKSLKFYGQRYHVVLNNNKTPLHWETLQLRYMPDVVNKLGFQIMDIPNIKWSLK